MTKINELVDELAQKSYEAGLYSESFDLKNESKQIGDKLKTLVKENDFLHNVSVIFSDENIKQMIAEDYGYADWFQVEMTEDEDKEFKKEKMETALYFIRISRDYLINKYNSR